MLRSGQAGFTLIELLITVSILAAVAFVAAGNYVGVDQEADNQLVRSEMQEIAKAIRQFHQDTGYYPKTGPFALPDFGGEIANINLSGQLTFCADVTDEACEDWFYSPANLWQLTTSESPLVGTVHQLKEWDPESGRGWRGPYLQGFDDGVVAVGDGISDTSVADDSAAAGNSTGYPDEGTVISYISAVADPFDRAAIGGYFVWRPLVDEDEDGNKDRALGYDKIRKSKWGRPYLLFGLDQSDVPIGPGSDGVFGTSDDITVAGPLLVSLGPDGEFATDDDIRLEIE